MVMIEAMACGTPVIAFNCGSVPEVIDHRETGFIVDTVSEAVRAVRQLHSFDRVHCRNVFEHRFSAKRMAADYIIQYERQIEQRRKLRVITKNNRLSLGTFRLTAGI
jgi:glycosyltransferase involved in cell wall biosynthesis